MYNKKIVSKYSVAPYNFVSLPNEYKAPYSEYEELKGHNKLSNELFNGFIEYTIVNETPLIVGATKKSRDNKMINFTKNTKGQYIIPGNTLRGIIRNNCAVLSLSSLDEFVDEARFYYRSFGKGINRNEYCKRLDIKSKLIGDDTITAPHRILGGYIYKDSENKFLLVPAKKINNQSYFVIREQYLRIMNPNVEINYMYNDKIKDLIYNKEKYKSEGRKKNREKINLLKKNLNEEYKPYYKEISFDIKGSRTISKIGKVGECKYNGYIMSSEFIQGKLVHYVVPEPDFESHDIVELSTKNGKIKFVNFYVNDLIRTKKKTYPNKDDKKDKEYFLLPKNTGKKNGKPIFYGKYKGQNNEEEQIYFGFSPYLRIPYDYSIKDLIPEGYKIKNEFSYMDSLFGFTSRNNRSYKSKLSFEDAVCIEKYPIEDKEYRLIVGEPHATSYPSYLQQDKSEHLDGVKDIKNYNTTDTMIRGIKQYWGKTYTEEVEDGSENVAVYIKPLKPGTKFKGKVYFSNLSKDELGLLLWSLKVDKNAHENIGYGKPYGFGRTEIHDIETYLENTYEKYSSMTGNYIHKVTSEDFISEYKNTFMKKFNLSIDEQKSVKEFKILKTVVVSEKYSNEARYMELSFKMKLPDGKIKTENEFNKLLPLPTPEQFLKIINWTGSKGSQNINSRLENRTIDKKADEKLINLKSGDIERTCDKCGDKFIINKAQQKALDERGLKYPKRCKKCR